MDFLEKRTCPAPWARYTVGMEQKDLEKLLAEIVEAMKQQEPKQEPEEEERLQFCEHQVVRVNADTTAEGESLRAGQIGTIVAVYGEGKAYAVEFPDLLAGPGVVTLRVELLEEEETEESD